MIHPALRKPLSGCLPAQMQLSCRLSPERAAAKKRFFLLLRALLKRKIPKFQKLAASRSQHILLIVLIEPGKIQLYILSKAPQLAVQRILLHLISQSALYFNNNHVILSRRRSYCASIKK